MAIGMVGFFVLGIIAAFLGELGPSLGCFGISLGLLAVISGGGYHS
jgi:hypothetical protein